MTMKVCLAGSRTKATSFSASLLASDFFGSIGCVFILVRLVVLFTDKNGFADGHGDTILQESRSKAGKLMEHSRLLIVSFNNNHPTSVLPFSVPGTESSEMDCFGIVVDN